MEIKENKSIRIREQTQKNERIIFFKSLDSFARHFQLNGYGSVHYVLMNTGISLFPGYSDFIDLFS